MSIQSALTFIPSMTVDPAWIDSNGHMNVAYYAMAFAKALDQILDGLGLSWNYLRDSGHSLFMLQSHIHYLHELMANAHFSVSFRLIDMDEKRLHYYMEMNADKSGVRAAAMEQVAIYVAMATRRPAPFPADVHERLCALRAAQKNLAKPDYLGRPIGLHRVLD